LKLPTGFEALEPLVKKTSAEKLKRGNVSISLNVMNSSLDSGVSINEKLLEYYTQKAVDLQEYATKLGASQTEINIDGLLSMRGVIETADKAGIELTELIKNKLLESFKKALEMLQSSRGAEGKHLNETIMSQVNQIDTLVGKLQNASEDRTEAMREKLHAKLSEVLANFKNPELEMDETRFSQELAILAVKADVTEELDRLKGHIIAANELLQTPPPVGRKLDFLMQEFNREANTLCAKSQDKTLTALGLELKVIIDQMREQVQNVE